MSDAIESKIMVQGQTGKMRAAIANAARSLAVKGKIEELGDGSIEVTAQGRKEAVEALVKKLREMPDWIQSTCFKRFRSTKPSKDFFPSGRRRSLRWSRRRGWRDSSAGNVYWR
ncbi:MAG: acylphosphatase [Candidatus Micrarchaeia archaeon]